MLEITLRPVPGRSFTTAESRELFRFGTCGGRVHNQVFAHRIVLMASGQLLMAAESTCIPAHPNGDIHVDTPVNLGDHITVDGTVYRIAARPGCDPHLEPVQPAVPDPA